MHCIEPSHRWGGAAVAVVAFLLASCSSSLPPWPAPASQSVPVESRSTSPGGRAGNGPSAGVVATPAPHIQPASPSSARAAAPGPATRARNWDEYRLHAAQRLVATNPAITYGGEVPEPLLAIPVLKIELNGDGSVRRIIVSRTPTQAADTVQLAIDAVKRAAPFGDVSHLPRPWEFSEVFLFDDDRRFKPRTLDL